MRVVLHANLFVSATLESRGNPARILDAWRIVCGAFYREKSSLCESEPKHLVRIGFGIITG